MLRYLLTYDEDYDDNQNNNDDTVAYRLLK